MSFCYSSQPQNCRAHFTEEEIDSETLRSMPKVTQLVNGRGGIWTRSQWTHGTAVQMCLPARCRLSLYKWSRGCRGAKSSLRSKRGYFTRKYSNCH